MIFILRLIRFLSSQKYGVRTHHKKTLQTDCAQSVVNPNSQFNFNVGICFIDNVLFNRSKAIKAVIYVSKLTLTRFVFSVKGVSNTTICSELSKIVS